MWQTWRFAELAKIDVNKPAGASSQPTEAGSVAGAVALAWRGSWFSSQQQSVIMNNGSSVMWQWPSGRAACGRPAVIYLAGNIRRPAVMAHGLVPAALKHS